VFDRIVLDDKLKGPAHVTVADWDHDGQTDILVSGFGKMGMVPTGMPAGQVVAYSKTGPNGTWKGTVLVSEKEGIKFPNSTSVEDVDGDGDDDLVVPYGFLACSAIPMGGPCGGLAWFERTAQGTLVRHDVVPNGAPLFYHRALFLDVDGDGVRDLISVGEEFRKSLTGSIAAKRSIPQWFKGNSSPARFESTPRELLPSGTMGLGSLPELFDVDGDGDLDVISAEFFVDNGSFAWAENPGARGAHGGWKRHVISANTGAAIMMAPVPNLYGRGTTGFLGTNHTNTGKKSPDAVAEAVFDFQKPADVRAPWTTTAISTGIQSRPGSMFAPHAAPGVFGWGDIDGDGDVDIAVSGDGDERVFWLEQTSPRKFETHVLATGLGQAGGMQVIPVGANESQVVVTSYEADTVLLFHRH
jgi:hypothetical protein